MDMNTAWEAFIRTGRVSDYIRYRQMTDRYDERDEIYEDEEYEHADGNEGNRTLGTKY